MRFKGALEDAIRGDSRRVIGGTARATKSAVMLPAREPEATTLPPGWRRHDDRWNGFALDLPAEWRVVVDGAKVYAFDALDDAVLFWPRATPADAPMSAVVDDVVRELAAGDATFEAWGAPGEGRVQTVMFRRRSREGALLRGALRVERHGPSAALVRGFQARAERQGEARTTVERIARSFTAVTAPKRLRTVDPTEGAWSVEHPEGWRVTGGVDRMRAQGGGIVVWRVEDPRTGASVGSDGAVIPMQDPSAGGWMGAMMGLAAPMMGGNARPFCDAATCVREVLLPLVQRQRPDIVIEQIAPDAEVERISRAQMEEPARRLGGTAELTACLAYSRYTEGGSAWRECAVVVAWRVVPSGFHMGGPMAPSGSWFISIGPVMRAHAGEFEATLPVLAAIARSFNANAGWEHREMDRAGQRMVADRMRAEQERAQILRDTMDYIHKVDAEITEHRQATNAEISRIGYNTVMGKEDVLDPDGYSHKVDSGYDAYWTRDDRILGSNSADLDSHLESDGWRKMKVF